MTIFQTFVLSIVQGITEVLPISSTAHLILTGEIVNINTSGDVFLIAVLHIGSTLAIIFFYREPLFEKFFSKEKLLFWLKILIASIPTVFIGIIFEDLISNLQDNKILIGSLLITIGILFIIFENINLNLQKVDSTKLHFSKMIIIGFGQSIALIPGTSRSGITTLVGMLCGLEKYSAFTFSFILSIPTLLGASMYEMFKNYTNIGDSFSVSYNILLISIIVSFIVTYLMLYLIKRVKKNKWLTVFGVYRIVIGIVTLLLFI